MYFHRQLRRTPWNPLWQIVLVPMSGRKTKGCLLALGALTVVSATGFGAGCTVTASILEAASRNTLDDELCIVSLSEERRVEEHEEEEEEEEVL